MPRLTRPTNTLGKPLSLKQMRAAGLPKTKGQVFQKKTLKVPKFAKPVKPKGGFTGAIKSGAVGGSAATNIAKMKLRRLAKPKPQMDPNYLNKLLKKRMGR